MAERIPQSVTKRVSFEAYLSSDHVTPATGKTIAITISKNGAAFGNPSGGATNAVEIASGSYYVDLTTTDTGTSGPLIVFGSVATVDPVKAHFAVVDAHNAGFDGIPSVASGSAGAVIVSGTGTAALSVSSGAVILQAGTGTGQLDFSSGIVKSNMTQILGTATSTPATAGILDVNLKNIANAAVSTSTAQLGVNAVQIGAVVPASATIGTVTTVGTLTTYTGNTPQTGDSFARLGVAGVGLTNLGDTRIANLDATVSSRTKPADTQAAVTLVATTTNLTNAAGAGDFTATMKTSLNAATPASVTGAVGSVTGAVGSVVADVGITQAGADKVWASAARTLTSFGTLVADVATAVWAAATRTLSAFAFQPTVGGYAGGQDPATLVLDVAASSHNIANSIGAKINAAGGAADPWSTTIPAAYGAGTAGYALGNLIPLLLKYDFTTITGEANNSPINAFRALRRVSINDSNGLITVYKEDGTSVAYTQQGTFDTNALPLQKID